MSVGFLANKTAIDSQAGDGLDAADVETLVARTEGWVTGLKCQKMKLGEPDASGRAKPIPIEGSEFVLPVDNVVLAIGTTPNPLLKTLPVAHDRRGAVVVDRTLAVPSHAGVWAVGDCAAITDAKTGQPCPPTAQATSIHPTTRTAALTSHTPRRGRSLVTDSNLFHRQHNLDPRACAIAASLDPAAVALDDRLDDPQPQPHAALLRLLGS